MGPSRSSRCCLPFILVALLVCHALVPPTLARTLIEKKLLVTAQTFGSEKSVSNEGFGGSGRGNGFGNGFVGGGADADAGAGAGNGAGFGASAGFNVGGGVGGGDSDRSGGGGR